MLRAVFDTNTILSAFLWSGHEAQAFAAVRERRIQLVVTDELFNEYRDVLSRPKFNANFAKAGLTRLEIFADLESLVEFVAPAEIPTDAVKDPKDLKVLACALGGQAEIVVSGDKKHLLSLGSYADIPIISTVDLLKRLAGTEDNTS